MKKVIGFSGLPGSGKTTALKGVKDLGTIITMGDIVRYEALNRKSPLNGENLGKIAKELREKFGKGIIAKRCIDVIEMTEDDVIFVDGLRSKAEVEVFKKNWKFPVIAIIIEEERRRNLLLERARSDDPLTREEILKREEREEKFGINNVINQADYKILNNSTKENLKERIRFLVKKIIKNY